MSARPTDTSAAATVMMKKTRIWPFRLLLNREKETSARFNNNLNGQILVFFIITVAAAEVSVGLALIVALYRKRQTAHVEDLTTMKL